MGGKLRHFLELEGRFYSRIVVPRKLREIIGRSELRAPMGAERYLRMTRLSDVYGFRLPDNRRDLTRDEVRWMEVLRDLYAGEVTAPRLIDVQSLRAALQRDHGICTGSGR